MKYIIFLITFIISSNFLYSQDLDKPYCFTKDAIVRINNDREALEFAKRELDRLDSISNSLQVALKNERLISNSISAEKDSLVLYHIRQRELQIGVIKLQEQDIISLQEALKKERKKTFFQSVGNVRIFKSPMKVKHLGLVAVGVGGFYLGRKL